jgi:hypothetical protein
LTVATPQAFDMDAEKALVSMAIWEPEISGSFLPHLRKEDFHLEHCRYAFEAVLALKAEGRSVTPQDIMQWVAAHRRFGDSLYEDILGPALEPLGFPITEDFAEGQVHIVKHCAANRAVVAALNFGLPPNRKNAAILDALEQVREAPWLKSRTRTAEKLLEARRFDFATIPPKPPPVFSLAEQVICTVGNISNIQAAAKGGKSAVVGSMIAAVINGRYQGADTLGFTAENPEGKALIHFDTEQSTYDHDQLVRRSIRRANKEAAPGWLMSYCVTDLSIPDRLTALETAIRKGEAEHGGVFAILLDGVADLCTNPNDTAESFALVGQLHALAIKHDCAIVTVLHENPGSETGKTRGHLGSQLERKAETNLRLAKDANGITTVWTEKARHGDIPKAQGICFEWSNEAAMHVSCGTASQIKVGQQMEKMREEAAPCFAKGGAIGRNALLEVIEETLGVSNGTARSRVKAWYINGIIQKNADGKYYLNVL